jgi:ABC-2 type transport system permease protein
MSKAWVIARKDIREASRSRSTYFYIVLLCLLSVPFLSTLREVLNASLRQGVTLITLQNVIQTYVNNASYTLPLVLTMLICGIFSAYSVIIEKARRTLESLLATPVSLRQIWIGKSLAVTLPSVIISLVVAFAAITALNFIFVVPRVGHVIFPDPVSILTAIVFIPVVTFFIVAIVGFLQLVIFNPRIANFAFTVIFLVVYFTTILGNASVPNLNYIFIGVAGVLGIATLILSRFLDKEKVVLSSKG